MAPEERTIENLIADCWRTVEEMYRQCREEAPNFGVDEDCFRRSVEKSLRRFAGYDPAVPATDEAIAFLGQLQTTDLFMAIACANGNERAWWDFDQQHRPYLERVARHLAKTEADAQEVIDTVYVELYGTRVVDGERLSKFSTYSGRGPLRGWLRTVVWHALVDLHRAGHDEISLDEMTENVGEGAAHSNFATPPPGGEAEMIEKITTDRFRRATVSSIDAAFGSLEDHEKLLLLFYHVENLKLREIATLVEDSDSPLRGWFQRKTRTRSSGGRTHESTVMRWLEKCYAKVLASFQHELAETHGLSKEEMDACMELVTQDISGGDLFRRLSAT